MRPYLYLLLMAACLPVQATSLYGYPQPLDTLHSAEPAPLLTEQFAAIYRFPSLYLNDDGELDAESQAVLEQALTKIEQSNNKVIVTLLGHSPKNKPKTQAAKLPTAFSNAWQNLGESSGPESSEAQKTIDQQLEQVKTLLLNKGLSGSQLYLENRLGFDQAYVETNSDARSLNQRVDLAVYLLKPKDSDGDGILDEQDRCAETEHGLVVDSQGCPRVYTLRLNYSFDSDKLRKDREGDDTASQLLQLNELAEILNEHPEYRVNITGYADSVGSQAYNQPLSLKRAKSVKLRLIDKGVDAHRISIQGKGEEKPLSSNETEEGRALNRRIEMRLYMK